jgi:gag-polyprotein putative aspartyl protease
MESIAQNRTIAEQATKPPYATKWGQSQMLGKGRERSNVGKQRQGGLTRQRCLYKREEAATESSSSLREPETTETDKRDERVKNENKQHSEQPCNLRTETYNLLTTLIEELSFLIVFIIFIFVRLCSQLLQLLIPLQTLESSTQGYKMGTPSDSPSLEQLRTSNIRWIGAMPSPGSHGAPHFIGANVTEFLRRYSATCKDHGLDVQEKIQRLPDYCELTIGQYIRTIPEWVSRDWDGLKKELLSEFRQDDTYQQMMSRKYLEALKDKGCKGMEDLRLYCRQYSSVSEHLVDESILDRYTQGCWFLEGLPTAVRRKLIRKQNVDINKPKTIDFKELFKAAIELSESERTEEYFNSSKLVQSKASLSELVDHYQTRVNITKEEKMTPPVVPHPGPTAVVQSSQPSKGLEPDPAIISLTKKMDALVLCMTAQRQVPSGMMGGNVRDQGTGSSPGNTLTQTARIGAQRPAMSWDCYFCGEEGHYQPRCPHFQRMVQQGEILFDWFTKKITLPGDLRPFRFVLEAGTELDQLKKAIAERASKGSAQAGQASQVNSIRLGMSPLSSDSDTEEELSANEDRTAWVGVKAVRAEKSRTYERNKTAPDAGKPLSYQQKAEPSFAVTKHLRTGTYKPATVTEIGSDGEEDVKMTDAPVSKSVRFEGKKEDGLKSLPNGSKREGAKSAKPTTKSRFAYSTASLFAQMQPEALLKKVFDQPLSTITVGELICHSPVLQDLMFGSQNKAGDQALRVSSIGIGERTDEKLYAAATPKLKVRVNDETLVHAMLDTGAEINVMTSEVAKEAGLAIRANPKLALVSHAGDRRQFDGICEDVEIDIGGIKTYEPIFVVTSADHRLILGQPYIFSSKLTISAEEDGMYATIPSADKSKTIRIRVMKLEDAGNRVEKDIFQEN